MTHLDHLDLPEAIRLLVDNIDYASRTDDGFHTVISTGAWESNEHVVRDDELAQYHPHLPAMLDHVITSLQKGYISEQLETIIKATLLHWRCPGADMPGINRKITAIKWVQLEAGKPDLDLYATVYQVSTTTQGFELAVALWPEPVKLSQEVAESMWPGVIDKITILQELGYKAEDVARMAYDTRSATNTAALLDMTTLSI